MKAIIQAGGKGTRLRPYTLILPKPLMPVGDQPVIEMLLKWLRKSGIKDTYITTGYLGHLMRALVGDGSKWGMNVEYTIEREPMGTVGALTLVHNELDDTFLVVNGDLITDLDLREMLQFHRSHGGLVTVATTTKKVNIDLGVLESKDTRVTGFREKPTMKFDVSMGLYIMEPGVLDLIPHGTPFGFDDLALEMLERNEPLHTFHHDGLWMDIGRPEDYEKAQEVYAQAETTLMGT